MAAPVEFAVLQARGLKVALGWKPRKRKVRRQIDPEWLRVHGHIIAPDGEWKFADSALTVDEVAALADWLRGHAEGSAGAPPEFIEHNLAFDAAPTDEGLVSLRICFRGEVAPPWIWEDPHLVWSEGYWLTLRVNTDQLVGFAAAIHGLIGR